MENLWGALCLVLTWWSVVCAQENNVCPTFQDYHSIKNNPKCWYNLAAEFNVPEIIKQTGYPVEEHKVTTVDGYILTMFRIPNYYTSNELTKRHPVYLQHGLLATCANFLGLGKNSLAFVLADAGYDVWLGNYRGNQYSEDHVNLTVNDAKYWDYGMDEVALLDLPAFFNRILSYSAKDSKIIFIGHSLGTTAALMFAAEYPEYSKDVLKMLVFLCPAYTLTNMISPFKLVVPTLEFMIDTITKMGSTRLFSQAKELKRVVVPMCTESPETMQYCLQIYNLFYGRETDFGPESIPVYFNQVPGGTSLRMYNHAGDLVQGYFRKYNFKKLNMKYYGSKTPPLYDISKIQIPVHITVSTQDWATTDADARILWRTLSEKARYGFRRIDAKFNHIDFVFGRHARKWVYDPLIQIINKAIHYNVTL